MPPHFLKKQKRPMDLDEMEDEVAEEQGISAVNFTMHVPFHVAMNHAIGAYFANHDKPSCEKGEGDEKGKENKEIKADKEGKESKESLEDKWGLNIYNTLHGLVFALLGSSCFASSTQVAIDPNKRLTIAISQDSMNRIAVANDRITQVFGDNEAYETQTEETTGQLFIKPMMENGDKPLSLTLITEKNVTQDLTLLPTSKEAATVILKHTHTSSSSDSASPSGVPGMAPFQPFGVPPSLPLQSSQPLQGAYYGAHYGYGMQGAYQGVSLSYHESLLEAMKKLTSQTLAPLTVDHPPQRQHGEALSVTFVSAYTIGSMRGWVFDVKNDAETAIELQEERFYTPQDLALCLDKHALKPKESTHLYVVTRC